jgi:hypothetical protein
VTGLGAAYNMAPDLALALAVAAVGLIGDPVAQTWSIGGSYSPILPLTSAAGILGAHNSLEGDASFGRVSHPILVTSTSLIIYVGRCLPQWWKCGCLRGAEIRAVLQPGRNVLAG